MIPLLSSGFIRTKFWISPWRIILKPWGSIPAWASKDNISVLVLVSLFILYKLCPFLLTILFIETSFESKVNVLSSLEKIISTIASLEGEATFVPMKIKLLAFFALIDLMLNLPRTKHRASEILLFPEPFGPKITFIPVSKGISVFLGNDLNPYITNLFT